MSERWWLQGEIDKSSSEILEYFKKVRNSQLTRGGAEKEGDIDVEE